MTRQKNFKMVRIAPVAAALLAVSVMTAGGEGINHATTDEFDNLAEIRAVASEKDVVTFRKELAAVRTQLTKLKERDMEALFGKPVPKPDSAYAIPVAHHRGFSLSGFGGYADPAKNKNHTEFYVMGRVALEVYYSIDGVSQEHILFYFQVDESFPRLTEDNLNERLAWDRVRLDELKALFEQQRAKVFVWEVDVEKEERLYAGIYQLDTKAKLDEWLLDGERLGYSLHIRKDSDGRSSCWSWYLKDGTLVREARCGGQKDALPTSFHWHYEDGHNACRNEYTASGQKTLSCWWWCRPCSSQRFRCEFSQVGHWRPDRWSWGGGKGKFHRQEWDDNEDGIPDWFSESGDGYIERRLQVSDSWALHPHLIPQAYQIQGQPNRCVPVRRIVPQTEITPDATPL